jgi:sRNA-binding carbon storage regulator CsrA
VLIGPNTVKLGIEAPREMNIVREELCAGSLPLAHSTNAAASESRPAARVAE